MKAYKYIKHLVSIQDLYNFIKLISKYIKLCNIIRQKFNLIRKQDYLHWNKIGYQLAINKGSIKWWKWIKRNIKTGKFSSCSSNPIKNKKGDIVTSTSDHLKVCHDYFKDQEFNINQDISIDEIV